MFTIALVTQLHLQPVYTPTPKETVTEVELSYIQKPIIPETQITIIPVYKPLPAFKTGFSSTTIDLYPDNTNCCVCWAKKQVGMSQNTTIGNGARLAINQSEPKIGSIGSLKGVVHAVVVTKIDGDMITFQESNFKKGFITQRTLPKSQFIGYIYL